MCKPPVIVKRIFSSYVDPETGFNVETDGKVVWVNDTTGCCVGRLAFVGIDIHKDGEAQMKTGTQCLDCAFGLAVLDMWDYFRGSMHLHYKIDLDARMQPEWSKNPRWRAGEEECPKCGKATLYSKTYSGVTCRDPGCGYHFCFWYN